MGGLDTFFGGLEDILAEFEGFAEGCGVVC
jgi:hypothetical protein